MQSNPSTREMLLAEMASPISSARLAANRANAKKSTGPRTEEGKARSRMNAIDHGITATVLRPEPDQQALDAYTARILPDLAPETELELDLALRIVSEMWRLHRIAAVEENIFAYGAMQADIGAHETGPVRAYTDAKTFLSKNRSFNNLSLYEQRLNRSLHNHMEELRKMQKERAAAATKRQPVAATYPAQPAENTVPPLANGFVFSPPQPDPAPPPQTIKNDPETMAA